jgi:H+/Cl- antiporter ClcA
MGLEYFEVAPYAIAAGIVCLSVFRACARLSFGKIWEFPIDLVVVDARHIAVSIVVGALAAMLAICWVHATQAAKAALARLGLDDRKTPVACGVLGGLAIGTVGMLLPPTLFWGEYEIKTLADASLALPNIWPKGGVWSLHPFLLGDWDASLYALIGVVKLFTISVTLLAGFRGGFIFPLFAVGTALGTALRLFLGDWLPMDGFPHVLFAMTFAAGLNTAITRTPVATPIILTTLCGQPEAAVPCLSAAMVALFMTKQVPFIMSQSHRPDMTTVLSCSSKVS